jgi:hypothetical protein
MYLVPNRNLTISVKTTLGQEKAISLTLLATITAYGNNDDVTCSCNFAFLAIVLQCLSECSANLDRLLCVY